MEIRLAATDYWKEPSWRKAYLTEMRKWIIRYPDMQAGLAKASKKMLTTGTP